MAWTQIAGTVLGSDSGSSDTGGAPQDTNVDASSSSSAGDVFGYIESAGSGLDSLLNPVLYAYNMVQQADQQRLAQANYERQFEENKRRFGLDYALRMAQFDMQKEQAAYNRKMASEGSKLSKAAMRENLKGTAQQRLQSDQKFAWDTEDRDKRNELSKSYSTGLMKGIMGGIYQ